MAKLISKIIVASPVLLIGLGLIIYFTYIVEPYSNSKPRSNSNSNSNSCRKKKVETLMYPEFMETSTHQWKPKGFLSPDQDYIRDERLWDL